MKACQARIIIDKKSFDVKLGTSISSFNNANNSNDATRFWTFNLFLTHDVDDVDQADCESPLNLTNLSTGIEAALLHALQFDTEASLAITFILTPVSGYIVRSDIFERRLECCELVDKVFSFLDPLSKTFPVELHPDSTASQELFDNQLAHAVAAIVWKTDQRSRDGYHARIEQLVDRLEIPWAINLAEPPQVKRLAWLGGRENYNVIGRAYEGARALGIKLVILDGPGHWLEDDNGPYAYLREAFIPCSINVSPDFTDRVVAAVRSYPHKIDGIMTISDVRLPGIARACQILGLPTSAPEAYEIAGNKARTRMLEDDAHESFSLASAAKLDIYLSAATGQQLPFPLIVKPCLGWNSDCVAKVQTEEELITAVTRASTRHELALNPSTAVVVEPYIAGPEVDANIFMLDSQILFFDCSDDFPSRGDSGNADMNSNFQETKVVMPSALPKDEQAALARNLRDSILRQGFTSGVFHCEARIRNPQATYEVRDGIMDLEANSMPRTQKIKTYLHEINARTPGYLESVAVSLTYGVCYYALRMLLALHDPSAPDPWILRSIQALSQPFKSRNQFHLSILIMPQAADRIGIMKTEDAGKQFLEQRGNERFREAVVDYDTWVKKGDKLEGPEADALWWVANFSVVSRKSRRDVLELCRDMEEGFDYEVE